MLSLSISRIAIGLIALFFLSDGLIKFMRGEKSHTFFKLAVSILIWGGSLAIALLPRFDHVISKQFGLGKDIDILILGGFIVAFIFLFNLLRIMEGLERNITEIVREQSLEKFRENIMNQK
jgi:hypothetical protein